MTNLIFSDAGFKFAPTASSQLERSPDPAEDPARFHFAVCFC